MGAASGGRLTLWLLALAVLIASGATGIVVTHSGSPPPGGGGSGSAQMLGSSDQRSDRGQPATAQAQPQTPPPGSAQAGTQARAAAAAEAAAARRAGRYNVGATHSPELLQSLSGSPASTGSSGQPRGVDVAADQHPGGASIDWAQVAAAGYSFAAVKATEGDYYANPYYAADAAGAQAAGLQVTGYHVAIPNVSGGAAQADYAVGHLGLTTAGGTPALQLDVEYDPYTATDHTNECYGLSAPQLVAWIGAFTQQARQLTGQDPMIYTTAGWWLACTDDSAAFSADSLWVAGHGPSQPALPATWAGYSCWQFTSAGTVPGIAARGSVDISYGSRHTTPYAPAVAGAAGGAAGAVAPAASSSRPAAAAAAPAIPVSAGAAASAAASTPGGPVAEVAPRPEATAPSPVASEASPSPGSSG